MIKHCNELAEKLGYDRLKFERGDISTYEGTDVADMVVTLHACDLATDYALDKAVNGEPELSWRYPAVSTN